jgi:hypothetical protein
MKQVRAQITDQAYAKIQESGKSVYQFVQDAITDSINAIERKEEFELMQRTMEKSFVDFREMIDQRFARFEKLLMGEEVQEVEEKAQSLDELDETKFPFLELEF